MKVSSSSILSIALALNGALASPLRARDYAVVTVTQFETQTVDVTETTWVDPAQYAPAPTEFPTPTTYPNEKNGDKNHVTMSTPSTTLSTPTSTTIPTPLIPTTTSLPTTTSIPTTTIPPTTLQTSTTSVSTPPAPSATSGPKTPSAGGGTTYTGDATFYSTGLGSCGITSSDSDSIVAISSSLYDSKATADPNKSPFCGTKVLISYNGNPEVLATIVDRCTGCKEYDLDLSPTLFTKMGANQNAGRVTITWRYAS